MKAAFLALLVLATPSVSSAADDAPLERSHAVEITVNVPVVAVSPQPGDRHFLNLPSLEYQFRIEPRCETGWRPESFSLNVADSRVSLSGAELNEGTRELLLRVPARQIAPVPVAGFCVIGEAEKGSAEAASGRSKPGSQLGIGGALSAHASLVCGSDDARDITYVARPLDVLLSCEAPQPEALSLRP